MWVTVTRERSALTLIALLTNRLTIHHASSCLSRPLHLLLIRLGASEVRRIWRVVCVQVNVVSCVIRDHESGVIDDIVYWSIETIRIRIRCLFESLRVILNGFTVDLAIWLCPCRLACAFHRHKTAGTVHRQSFHSFDSRRESSWTNRFVWQGDLARFRLAGVSRDESPRRSLEQKRRLSS